MSGKTSHPEGIRVWRGFRSRQYRHDRSGFEKKLEDIFVPHTAQQMIPLGLQSYFPALVPELSYCHPDKSRLIVPDEVALVVYADKQAYTNATKNSVAGRAYGLLHVPVFNFSENKPNQSDCIPASLSAHPKAWQPEWMWDCPYYLIDQPIDWWTGSTWLLIAQPLNSLCKEAFHAKIANCVSKWQQQLQSDVDGSILCISEEYLLYWEHRKSQSDKACSFIPDLLPVLEAPLMHTAATVAHVPTAFRPDDHNKFTFTTGDFLDVRVDIRY